MSTIARAATRSSGHRTLKCPIDLWTYHEIVVETRTDLVVQCGTHLGGSALYSASICELIGHGRLLSIDIDQLTCDKT